MLNQQTLTKLRQMKLNGMAAAFERQMQQPNNYELAFEERMGLLVDAESTSRDNRRQARLNKQAKFKLNIQLVWKILTTPLGVALIKGRWPAWPVVNGLVVGRKFSLPVQPGWAKPGSVVPWANRLFVRD